MLFHKGTCHAGVLSLFYGFASARHASTAKPTLSTHQYTCHSPQHSIEKSDLPPLLDPNNIINHIPVQLREHALQGFDDNFVFLRLNPSCLFRLSACLSCRGGCLVILLRSRGFLGVLLLLAWVFIRRPRGLGRLRLRRYCWARGLRRRGSRRRVM